LRYGVKRERTLVLKASLAKARRLTSLTLDTQPTFDTALRNGLRDLLTWRRDVRTFKTDALPAGMIERLIEAACLSPSVGLSEPWRFVIVEDPALRQAVRANFEACNAAALALQDESRQALYARLKLSGLDQAPVHIAAFAETDCEQGHGLGRQTMPTALDYSVAIAVHTLWLAARIEGIGLGWVSIVDPEAIIATLGVPPSWHFIGYLCIGYPQEDHALPALQRAGWDERRAPACRILYR
jgi:5,6-dimethylbenzimidazole synthase